MQDPLLLNYIRKTEKMFSYIKRVMVVIVIVWYLDLQLTMRSVPITTNVVGSDPAHGEVYNIMWWSLSVTCDRSVVFSGHSGFLHQ